MKRLLVAAAQYINQYRKNATLCLAVCLLAMGLYGCLGKQKSIDQLTFKVRKDKLKGDFPKIPHEEILHEIAGNRLYAELQEDYKNALIKLKTETDADGALLVVVIATPDVGKEGTITNNYGIPYILKCCDNISINCVDLSPFLAAQDQNAIVQVSQDRNWSKLGALLVADRLDSIIIANNIYESGKRPSKAKKPPTFGDLPPGQDEVIERENYQSYRLKVNKQGLRMNQDLKFPKTKQTILILGDEKVYSPYLDNQFIATSILQQRHPDKVIINAGNLNYTMDDYETLYADKARYTEPDIVIVCTNGEDILEQYFTQRNYHSRAQKIYLPTDAEADFYELLFAPHKREQ